MNYSNSMAKVISLTLLSAVTVAISLQVMAAEEQQGYDRRNIEGLWRTPAVAAYSYDIEEPTPDSIIPGAGAILAKAWVPLVVDTEDGKLPYQPWARERREYLHKASADPKTLQEADPNMFCVPSGSPRFMYYFPVQIQQYRDYVVMLTEMSHGYRIVSLDDNKPQLPEEIKLFVGDSRGKWEGDTFVVDVTNNNGRNWLSVVGDFHSDQFKIQERYTRTGQDTMMFEALITDPVVYSRPFTMQYEFIRVGTLSPKDKIPSFAAYLDGYELLESACHEGNEGHFEHLMKLKEEAREEG